MSVGAVVLSGGRARRFGADKSLATVADVPLLDRVLAAASAVVDRDDVIVVGEHAPPGIRRSIEPERDLGPLNGLAHGMAELALPHALVLGCDHPYLQPELLRMLAQRCTDVDCVIAAGPDGPEPLVACYSARAGEAAARLVGEGERRLLALMDAVPSVLVDASQWGAVDPQGRSFLDVDRPEDLRRARQEWSGD